MSKDSPAPRNSEQAQFVVQTQTDAEIAKLNAANAELQAQVAGMRAALIQISGFGDCDVTFDELTAYIDETAKEVLSFTPPRDFLAKQEAELEKVIAERDLWRVENDSRALWIAKMCKILGYDNSDGFHSEPDPFTIAQARVKVCEAVAEYDSFLQDPAMHAANEMYYKTHQRVCILDRGDEIWQRIVNELTIINSLTPNKEPK